MTAVRPAGPVRSRSVTMCAVCRRHLLAGERYRHWSEADRPGRPVCGLCEAEAARVGWVRESRELKRERATGLRLSVRLVG